MSKLIKNRRIFESSGQDLSSIINDINYLNNNEYKITYYEIVSGTSGSLTIPTGATINAGEFGLSGNSILSKINGSNKVTWETPRTAGGVAVTANLNESTGAWTTSGTYTDLQVALIYSIRIKAENLQNLNYDRIIESEELDDKVQGPATSTDNAIVRFDGTTGRIIQNSNILINDAGVLILPQLASQAYVQGGLYYDNIDEALTFYNNDSNVALQIGQENWIRVRNSSGSTIANGSAVYINGVHASGIPTIALAQANAVATTIVAGVVTETIANNAVGFITSIGLVRNINTSAFTDGATLFLSATTPGAFVSTSPTSPNYRFRVGIVTRSHATNGTIHVTPSTGALGNGTTGQILSINGTGNQYFRDFIGYTVFGYSTDQTLADSTTYFVGSLIATQPGTAWQAGRNVYFPKAGIIKGILFHHSNTAGTNEAVPAVLRLNDTTDIPLFNLDFSQTSATYFLALNQTVTANGDAVQVKITVPVMATNPTLTRLRYWLYIESA